MFDGNEEFAGMRLRSDEGEQWALRGSRQGIFVPDAPLRYQAAVFGEASFL